MYEDKFREDPFTKEKYPQSIYHDSKQLKWVGKADIKRVDALEKVTGQAKFADDQMFPNMGYLVFKLCPHAHAKVKSMDTSKAKALPGVIMVITPDDVPDLMVNAPTNYVLSKEAWEEGDEVAAVVAEDEDIAEEAVALIDVQYEVLPFILYAKDGMKPGAPIIRGTTNEVGSAWIYKRGNVDTGFAAADKVVEQEYTCVTRPWTGARPVAPICEERITVRPESQGVAIWIDTQGPHGDVRTIAAQLGLPYSKVVVYHTFSGVGFGGKGSSGRGKILAPWAAQKTNRPVKYRSTAEQGFNSNRSCHSEQNRTIKVGVKTDGTLTAYHEINWQSSGAWGGKGSNDASAPLQYMYTVPNLYAEGHDVFTNSMGTGVPRCVQHPEASFQQQIHMDRVAEAINMDPADFLVKICFKGKGVGGHPDKPEWDMGSNPMPDMLQKLIQDSSWKTRWKGWKTPVSVSGSKKRGVGIALHVCRHGLLTNPMSAMVASNLDGTFSISCGSHDVGTGWRTAAALMAAEELGVKPDQIVCSKYDTASTQESMGTGGSRVTRASGTAIILACRDVKRQLFQMAIAAKMLDATKPEDLETADGNIYLKSDPTKTVKIAAVAAKQQTLYLANTTSGTDFGGPIIGRGSYATKRDPYMHMQWNLTVAEVEVDVDTGEVKVIELHVAHDAGRVVWAKGALNQAWGGLWMSQGLALYEGLVKDEGTGVTLNPNYLDYKIPTYADLATLSKNRVDWFETIDPYGPFGVKGIAEPLYGGGGAAAISNAIYNACGARINSPNITPDKILAAIGKA